MKVLLIDYGMSNLGSVGRAIEECDGDVSISDDPSSLGTADRIVLPGVGAFRDGMTHLQEAGWPEAIRQALENPSVKLLGICLGMQLLGTRGEEGGETSGLNLIPGEVTRLKSTSDQERVPHMGWNEVHQTQEHPLLRHIADGTDFYFVHSYHFRTTDPAHTLATTPYCGGFTSVVGRGNVWGAQFHPEKSSRPGFQIIRNFLTP